MSAFGRSATVSSLKDREKATFFDSRNSRQNLAFSAKRADSKLIVLAHSMGSDERRLIATDGGGWNNVPAWVLPAEASLFADHASRVSSNSLGHEDIWNTLHIGPTGSAYLPVYQPRFGAGILQGWYNVITGDLEDELDDRQHELQCFKRWGIRMLNIHVSDTIWQSW